jgi:hypothetical protein
LFTKFHHGGHNAHVGHQVGNPYLTPTRHPCQNSAGPFSSDDLVVYIERFLRGPMGIAHERVGVA